MPSAHTIVLVRHGETVGESSIRYYGATDVALSGLGRSQMRATATRLAGRAFSLVVASPLSRARESADIVAPGARVLVDERLREIDFGSWEGLTAEEIALRDPELYRAWQTGRPGFEYPLGEHRAGFRARIAESVDAILAGSEPEILVVVHKGVIRQIVAHVTRDELADGEPELGGVVELRRSDGGSWGVHGAT